MTRRKNYNCSMYIFEVKANSIFSGHFGFWRKQFCGWIDKIIVPSYSLAPKPMTRRQNYNGSMYTFEVRAHSNYLAAIMDFGRSHFVFFRLNR